jgi:hypothetical protein
MNFVLGNKSAERQNITPLLSELQVMLLSKLFCLQIKEVLVIFHN